jgi:hypothetical protein
MDEINKNLPTNIDQSCFVTSVLVALMLEEDEYVNSHMLMAILHQEREPSKRLFDPNDAMKDRRHRTRMQNVLIKFTNAIRGNGDALPVGDDEQKVGRRTRRSSNRRLSNITIKCLRAMMATAFTSDYSDGNQHDAMEFLQSLLSVFSLDHRGGGLTKHRVFCTNDLLSQNPSESVEVSNWSDNDSGIVCRQDVQNQASLDNPLQFSSDDILHDGFYHAESDQTFFRKNTMAEYLPQTSTFIIHIDRSIANLTTPQNAPVARHIGPYDLRSAVIHDARGNNRGHYTSIIFAKNGDTYHFDDNRDNQMHDVSTTLEDVIDRIMAERATILIYTIDHLAQ